MLAYQGLGSKQKWLEVHGRKKWGYYYQESSLRRAEAFYRKFLKGEPSEVDNWPPVQIEVRERAYVGTVRAEEKFPLVRMKPVKKYLDAASGTLKEEAPTQFSEVSYESRKDYDQVHFDYKFDKDTELTGSMRLRLWVSTDEGDDMDLFVQIDKLDTAGKIVPFVFVSMLDDGPVALGWLRVSHRELDTLRSTLDRPWLHHRRRLLLRPNEVVPVDIEIWPSSTLFRAGESLRVTIQGNDILRYDLRQVQLHQVTDNKGRHFIHTGGLYESYLLIPQVDNP